MARWKLSDRKTLALFAPYAAHCLRVETMFLVGMAHNMKNFGTKPSNLIDLQYLFYAPFCMIFSSNDKLLIDLAPLILRANQSFVTLQELKASLDTVAQRRKESEAAGQEDANPVEPDDQSLIQALWKKHVGKFRPQAVRQTFTPEHIAEVNGLLKPFNEAIEAAQRIGHRTKSIHMNHRGRAPTHRLSRPVRLFGGADDVDDVVRGGEQGFAMSKRRFVISRTSFVMP